MRSRPWPVSDPPLRGDPIHVALVPLGKFLRAALQAADFVNAGLRGALRPVPDRSEPANTLQRAIDSGRVVPARVKRADEDQAGTRALSLLAKMLTAWNTP